MGDKSSRSRDSSSSNSRYDLSILGVHNIGWFNGNDVWVGSLINQSTRKESTLPTG